jgi:putative GTP pyrophosphokinase
MKEEIFKRLEDKKFTDEEKAVIKELVKDELLYDAALREIKTRVEILRDDFRRSNAYNPIEHIKTRIKLPCSILKKAYVRDWPLDAEYIKENMNDLAGIRIVCTFKSDIYKIVNLLKESGHIEVLKVKDYIENPKESGYQSYHMIVNVPVYMISGKTKCKVEVQLRTMAMDFWASLEHKIKYKYDYEIPEDIKSELLNCSKVADDLDDKMLRLHRRVHNPNELQVETNL